MPTNILYFIKRNWLKSINLIYKLLIFEEVLLHTPDDKSHTDTRELREDLVTDRWMYKCQVSGKIFSIEILNLQTINQDGRQATER